MSFSKIIIVGRYQSQQPLTPLSEMQAQQDQLRLFVDLPDSDASRPQEKKMSPECTELKERTDRENRSANQIESERQAWRLESLILEIIQNMLKKGERKHVWQPLSMYPLTCLRKVPFFAQTLSCPCPEKHCFLQNSCLWGLAVALVMFT